MTAAAQRMKAMRERQAQGRVMLMVECEAVPLEEALISEKFLAPADRENRNAIEAALGAMIRAFVIDAGR